ncbi:glycoside hydrolase family 3 C-terminal domain-containing protein [Paenarthrobacter nicotinovorans]|uniref:glycoside hydrolase family 3 C-terminal domain-containing protein n=1 Tax=Paenarthrobacter nicotinovorans TaxID=29320 RepID=UPI003747940D
MIHPRISQLSLAEKAGLVSGGSFWSTRAVEHAGIPAMTLTDGPHGVRLQSGDADHLGIMHSEPATAFPTAAATGSSWSPSLHAELGAALGVESRAAGVDVLLGPGVNIKRSPLCGRNFEYFSEDPVLSGALGAAWVRGIQEQGVGASVKHYAANNQETDRQRIDVIVDERTLREIYLPAFERTVKESSPATVMCSYNKVNGTHASQNPWLLTEVLRGDWGFEGYVVSDWGAVADPVASVAAGLDLEMPGTGERSIAAIIAAVENGSLDEAVLDLAVSRIISVHERLLERRTETILDLDAHHDLARRAAVESSVLLVNEDGILPLDPNAVGRIAVIGEFARTPRFQGGGSSHVNPTRVDDALSAITSATGREVVFAPGFGLDGAKNAEAVREAVATAESADVVVLFLGLPEQEESEGFDRTSLDLPVVQRELLEHLLEVNDRIVVVLSNGGVVSLSGIAGRVPAILETWLSGQAGGSAVADILFGNEEPGGRLAETIPICLSDTPAYINWPGSRSVVNYGERHYVGYRWYDSVAREVAFPFGHGLGYTTYEYSNLVVTVDDPRVAHAVVEVTVTNVGQRTGSEVVQVYVSDPESVVDRPIRELKGFEKVQLAAGESTRVSIELTDRAFAFWLDGEWVVQPGTFEISVGSSSRSLHLRKEMELAVPPINSLNEASTLGEWLADPVGSVVVKGVFASQGAAAEAMMSADVLPLVSSMPLRTLLSFGGQTDGRAVVEQLLVQVAYAGASV